MSDGPKIIIRRRDWGWTGLGLVALIIGFTADVIAPDTGFARSLASDTAKAAYGFAVALTIYAGRRIHIAVAAPREALRLRECWFQESPAGMSVQATSDLPHIYCVIMDWPANSVMTTVVAVSTGVARIFTSKGMMLFAGPGSEGSAGVVAAAMAFVRDAHRFLPDATSVAEHGYPSADSVRFYLRTFNGLLLIEEKTVALTAGTSPYTTLFAAGNALMTELFKAAGFISAGPAAAGR